MPFNTTMKQYLQPTSGAVCYDYDNTSITVGYKAKKTGIITLYTYNVFTVGPFNMDMMKRSTRSNKGLNSFIDINKIPYIKKVQQQ